MASGCGAPRTTCAYQRRRRSPSRRNCLRRKLQGDMSHRGTERTEKQDLMDPRFHFKLRIVKFSLFPLCLCVSMAVFFSSCGYHVGGTGSRLPPGLKVIAVPALVNRTSRYRVEQRMTEAVVREFLARTRYRIVSTEDSADAVLRGEITSLEAVPAVFDTTPTATSNPS